MTESALHFSHDQKKQLLGKCGLIATQIDELESRALPVAKALLRRQATLTEVRTELEKLSKAMARANAVLSSLVPAPPGTSLRLEILTRLQLAGFDLSGNSDSAATDRAVEATRTLSRIVQRALQDLPKEQRRDRSASILPVMLIDRALRSGFVRGYSEPHDPSPHVRVTKLKPPYLLKPSSSPKSIFRVIVGICYEAMTGKKDIDPERAIKSYLAWRKTRREAVEAAMR